MANTILVNQERCTGCWSCSMACKVAHDLPADKWRQSIRTIGSGDGMDEPAGEWPDCTMGWMPVYSKRCTLGADCESSGGVPHCVYACPTHALTFGDAADPESELCRRVEELRSQGFRIYELPSYEETRTGVLYAKRMA